MSLKLQGYLDLPAHIKPGGFDHAAVHRSSARLYVAHPINDSVDVIDCTNDRYLHSIPNLKGVAGALVSDESDLIFTSNRGEDSISIFAPEDEAGAVKVHVGIRPNGLSFDPGRNLLLAANVGDPEIADSFTISIVDVAHGKMITSIPVAGRTRWTVFDPHRDVFYVNIAKPARIVLIDANHPNTIMHAFDIPSDGPHGLDLDTENRRLFCACDDGQLITLNADDGNMLGRLPLSGAPDVIFHNAALQHLYVAIGDPGVIDVYDTIKLQKIETVQTERGAHTMAFDPDRQKVYAFLPETHRAMIHLDT